MTDKQAIEILNLLQPVGLARTARDISVARIKGMMEIADEIKAIEPPNKIGKGFRQGFDTCKIYCEKIIAKHRKEQNW